MHYCLVVDLDRCSGCHSCEVACKMENGIGLGVYWNKVLTVGPAGTFPDLEMYWLPVQCQQCEDAACVSACPTGASYRDPKTNVVLINKEKCLGCKYCVMACPYGVRWFNEDEKVVEKCTLCPQLTSAGEVPACVHNCSTAARIFGDLDDPESDVSKAIAAAGEENVHSLPDAGNHPATRYILHKKTATWKEG
jgi:Fe-S-cluster-containing dehydrogenase component